MDADEILKIWRDCGHAVNDGNAIKFARKIIKRTQDDADFSAIKELLEEASEILGNSMFQYCDTEAKARNLSSRIDKAVLKIQSDKEDQ